MTGKHEIPVYSSKEATDCFTSLVVKALNKSSMDVLKDSVIVIFAVGIR